MRKSSFLQSVRIGLGILGGLVRLGFVFDAFGGGRCWLAFAIQFKHQANPDKSSVSQPPDALGILGVTGIPIFHVFGDGFDWECILGQRLVAAALGQMFSIGAGYPF